MLSEKYASFRHHEDFPDGGQISAVFQMGPDTIALACHTPEDGEGRYMSFIYVGAHEGIVGKIRNADWHSTNVGAILAPWIDFSPR